MEISPKRVLIACGGTGGHLAPGIALAQTLISRGHSCELLISQKKVDQELIKKYPNLVFRNMPAISLGKTHSHISPLAFFQFTARQISSLFFCAKIFRRFRPHAVVGFGGFSSLSAAVCAASTRTPVFLHEANQKVGDSIRALARFAQIIYLPPGIENHKLPARKVKLLGLPMRTDMQMVARDEARKALGFPLRGKLLVIMGGSQGAGALNDWARDHLDILLENGIHLYCVTGLGKGDPRAVEHQLSLGQIAKAIFVPFSDQMHLLYAAADLVVGRAGAGTISELIRFRTPSILVPYPFAAERHQHANAQWLEKLGGCVVIDESKIETLTNEVLHTLKSDTLMDSLKSNLRKIDLGDPAKTIAEEIERVQKVSPKKFEKNQQTYIPETLESEALEFLKKKKIKPESIKLSFNELIGAKTTFGIGGPARIYAEPTDEKTLAALIKLSRKLKIPFFCLGRGSNLLVLDKGFDGLVIRLGHTNWQRVEFQKNGHAKAWAGVKLKALCGEACRLGLMGFEFMEGIPATLGGALRMNAGAFGGWTFDRVENVCYITPQGKIKIKSGKALKPAYRGVESLNNCIVLWATLKPQQSAETQDIKKTIDAYQTKRKSSQPREASAGCVFKNPSDKIGAGKLIDEAGLKGTSVGGAMVSPIHANFIVNTGGATSNDVISLINQIRQKIWNTKKINLQPEIMLLGGDWKNYLVELNEVNEFNKLKNIEFGNLNTQESTLESINKSNHEINIGLK